MPSEDLSGSSRCGPYLNAESVWQARCESKGAKDHALRARHESPSGVPCGSASPPSARMRRPSLLRHTPTRGLTTDHPINEKRHGR